MHKVLYLVPGLMLAATALSQATWAQPAPVGGNVRPIDHNPGGVVLHNPPVAHIHAAEAGPGVRVMTARGDSCCAGQAVITLNLSTPEIWVLNPASGVKRRMAAGEADPSDSRGFAGAVAVLKPTRGSIRPIALDNGTGALPADAPDGALSLSVTVPRPLHGAVPRSGTAPTVAVSFSLTKHGAVYTD